MSESVSGPVRPGQSLVRDGDGILRAHGSRIAIPATPNRSVAEEFCNRAPLEEVWEQFAACDFIPSDWVQNPRRHFEHRIKSRAIIVSIDPLITFPSADKGDRPEPTHEPNSRIGDVYAIGAPCFVRRTITALHPPSLAAMYTFVSLDQRAILQAEALITEDACRNSYPPPGHVTWVFGDVLIYEDGFPDETELELYKLGFARPPRKPPWDSATLVCPVLIPSTAETPPSS